MQVIQDLRSEPHTSPKDISQSNKFIFGKKI
nr:MAG TPA: hypothetical protein [Caudoviricetes sp.]DAY34097.1 MAG TPA: hypothetical protein [Caudoviricetes sp.]